MQHEFLQKRKVELVGLPRAVEVVLDDAEVLSVNERSVAIELCARLEACTASSSCVCARERESRKQKRE